MIRSDEMISDVVTGYVIGGNELSRSYGYSMCILHVYTACAYWGVCVDDNREATMGTCVVVIFLQLVCYFKKMYNQFCTVFCGPQQNNLSKMSVR